ncbi:hypothetical protein BGX21_005420 [Mortierella sp. AD011]|nr:hypothetical protein BGX21_005420 [Mortierella sp. AD011]
MYDEPNEEDPLIENVEQDILIGRGGGGGDGGAVAVGVGGGRRGSKPPNIITQVTIGPYDAYEDEEHDDGYISSASLSLIDQNDSNQTLVGSDVSSDVNISKPHLSNDSGGAEDSFSLQPTGSPLRRRPSLLTAFEFNDVVRSLTLSGSRGRLPSYDTSYYGSSSPKSPKSPKLSKSPNRQSIVSPLSLPNTNLPSPNLPSPNLLTPGYERGNLGHGGSFSQEISPRLLVSPISLGPDDEIISSSPLPVDLGPDEERDSHIGQVLRRHSLILPDHHDPVNHHLGHVHVQQTAVQSLTPRSWSTRSQEITEFLKSTKPIYFPTLLDWNEKSPFVKFLAVTSVPMVLLLTLTLPVVELCDDDDGLEIVQDNVDSPLIPKIVISDEEEYHEKYEGWSRTATTVQMLLAPTFIATVITSAAREGYLAIPAASLTGVGLSFLVRRFSTEEHPPRFYGAFCFAGFLVAITWIFLVANEVVGILQAFGMIFGVSDAILGLTIFAMGNSLGDLVANITMAKMGFPRMAFSACFGGPLLNMLLGVGISGTYTTMKTGTSIPLKVSPTLIVSLIGVFIALIAAVIVVPRNGYMMTRAWGWFLVSVYLICTVANVIIEIATSKT